MKKCIYDLYIRLLVVMDNNCYSSKEVSDGKIKITKEIHIEKRIIR